MSLRTLVRHTSRSPRAIAALAFAVLLPGCGSLINELESSQMAVGVLLQTTVPDPNHMGQTIPGPTVFSLEFASVNVSALNSGGASQAATPTDGAMVQLQYHDAAANKDVSLTVPGSGNGSYSLNSQNSQLTFQPMQQYTTVITYAGKTYKMNVTPPKAIKIKEFEDTPLITNYQAGTSFTVTRDPSTDTNVAFYDLASLDSSGNPTQVTTNAPQDAAGFLNLILSPAPFKQPSFTIDGMYFKASTPYLVTLASLQEGGQVDPSTDTSVSALFAGSTFLAGASTGGLVMTK